MSRTSFMTAIRSSRLQITAFALTVGYLIWTVGSGWAFQGSEHVISQRKNSSKEPLKIISIVANNKQHKLDESFSGSDDWLRGTRLLLRNDSDKDIIYVEFRLNFPETRSSGNEMAFPLELGNMPGLPISRDPLMLRPGQEVTLPLTEDDYKALTKFLESRHKLSTIRQVQLEVGFVVYNDDTAWQRGVLLKRHPSNPKAWVTIN